MKKRPSRLRTEALAIALVVGAKTQKKRADGTAVAGLAKGTQVDVVDVTDPQQSRRYDLKKVVSVCNLVATSVGTGQLDSKKGRCSASRRRSWAREPWRSVSKHTLVGAGGVKRCRVTTTARTSRRSNRMVGSTW